jgi:hypothetical protein
LCGGADDECAGVFSEIDRSDKKEWRRLEMVVNAMIQRGCDINLKDASGLTPLFYATYWDTGDVSLLLQHGADPYVDGVHVLKDERIDNRHRHKKDFLWHAVVSRFGDTSIDSVISACTILQTSKGSYTKPVRRVSKSRAAGNNIKN